MLHFSVSYYPNHMPAQTCPLRFSSMRNVHSFIVVLTLHSEYDLPPQSQLTQAGERKWKIFPFRQLLVLIDKVWRHSLKSQKHVTMSGNLMSYYFLFWNRNWKTFYIGASLKKFSTCCEGSDSGKYMCSLSDAVTYILLLYSKLLLLSYHGLNYCFFF